MGCAETVVTIRPEPYQDPGLSLPLTVKVALKQKTLIHGIYRSTSIRGTYKVGSLPWETDRIQGEQVAWGDEQISVVKAGYAGGPEVCYKVSIADIEKMEVTSGSEVRTAFCLGGAGAFLLWGTYGLIEAIKSGTQ